MPYKVASGAAYLDDMQHQIAEGSYDYTVNGECSGCGECCSNLLPMTRREIERVRQYVERRKIKPQKHFVPTRSPVIDGICPFRDSANRRCTIYDVRPDICRAYRCDKAKRGDFSGDMSGEFADYSLVDVRETFFSGFRGGQK